MSAEPARAMARPPRRRRWVVLGSATAAVVYALFVHTPSGPRSVREFDPDRVASLEVDMRDRGREQPDWAAIADMLHRSYRELHAAVH